MFLQRLQCNQTSNLRLVGYCTAHIAIALYFHTKRLEEVQHKRLKSCAGLRNKFEGIENSVCFWIQSVSYPMGNWNLNPEIKRLEREIHHVVQSSGKV
jgi:hypothetical protein